MNVSVVGALLRSSYIKITAFTPLVFRANAVAIIYLNTDIQVFEI